MTAGAARIPNRPYLLADPRSWPPPAAVVGSMLRRIDDADLDGVGALMAEAFRGTVDDEGETVEQLADQLRAATTGQWGEPSGAVG